MKLRRSFVPKGSSGPNETISVSPVRAGLYARVSTNDQQTLPMQMRALREYAARRGWTTTMQVKEVGSGATQRQMRERLVDAAWRREIDVVLVWRGLRRRGFNPRPRMGGDRSSANLYELLNLSCPFREPCARKF